jgi:hypothetical protein
VGPEDRDDEPKGFLDEVFERRQRVSEPFDEPDGADVVEDVEDVDDVEDVAEANEVVEVEVVEVEVEDAETRDVGRPHSAAPVTDAGDDPLHPGAAPEPGAAGGSGIVPDELGTPEKLPPQPVAHELDPFERALIDEAMKKSGIVWLDVGTGPIAQAAWYVWLDGAAYVLTGDAEQPDPGLATATSVGVFARSKETRSLLIEWVGSPTRVWPGDEGWDAAAQALAKARLNLPDPATAPQRWAADPAVAIYRIAPSGPLLEAPGRYSDSSRRAVPVPTQATTAGPPPKVIHRRQTSRRPLS